MIYHGDVKGYIYDTPNILNKIMVERIDILESTIKNIFNCEFSKLYIVGSGSSYHGALCGKNFIQKIINKPVVVMYPMPFVDDISYIESDAIVIGISQQGTSTSTIKALDEARKNGCKTISMTGEYNTEIIKHSDSNIYIECGIEDAGATTKGYSATAFTLFLLALELGRYKNILSKSKYEKHIYELKKTIDNIPQIIDASENWYEKNRDKLIKCSKMIVIGYSNNIATMFEGTLKVTETCRFSVRGYELEEFMHGIYNSIDEDTHIIYIAAPGVYQERIYKLYNYYRSKIKYNFVLNPDKDENGDEKNLSCKYINSEDFSPFEYIIIFQILMLRLSKDLGINMNEPLDPEFHKIMASKIE